MELNISTFTRTKDCRPCNYHTVYISIVNYKLYACSVNTAFYEIGYSYEHYN